MNIKRLVFAISCGLMTLLLGNVSADGPANGQLTASEKRGKLIYLLGTSPSGKEITCYLGDASTEVPATAMLCANCHGFDGRGNPEGGVVPSDITWQALTKSYGGGETRRVTRAVAGSVRVAIDGAELLSGWTLEALGEIRPIRSARLNSLLPKAWTRQAIDCPTPCRGTGCRPKISRTSSLI